MKPCFWPLSIHSFIWIHFFHPLWSFPQISVNNIDTTDNEMCINDNSAMYGSVCQVTVYGDGTGVPLSLRDWALVDYDHVREQGEKYTTPHCIAETFQSLSQRVKEWVDVYTVFIESSFFTCLYLVLLVCMWLLHLSLSESELRYVIHCCQKWEFTNLKKKTKTREY